MSEYKIMNHSLKIGLSFGLVSGVITTLGLIVGLHSGTHSKAVVMAGILTIAIADAFSDAFGIHISEESECKHTDREIWQSTAATFLSKFIFALSFITPLFIFGERNAIIADVGWGIFLLTLVSFFIAEEQNKNPWVVAGEHLAIASVVIILTHYVGVWISSSFGK